MTRITIYILFTFGGVAGLIYEVMWMRSLGVVFGSSTRAAAVVLAAFFAGMALGNLLGGRLASRPSPLRMYGWAEIAVGLTALLVGPWLALFTRFYPSLYESLHGEPALFTLVKLGLAFVAMGPPAVAMGVTLPLLVRALVSSTDHVARRTGLLYALNTGGATIGALLGGFVLPPSLGIRQSIYLAVGINLVIGIVAVLLGAKKPREESGTAEPTREKAAEAGRKWPELSLIVAAAISGFGTLTLEVLYTRMLARRSDGSVYTFALMLATFLIFLALGSAAVSRWLDRSRAWRFLAWTQIAAVLTILLSPLMFDVAPYLVLFAEDDTLTVHHFKLGVATMITLGPPVLFLGMVLPATWKMAARSVSMVSYRVGVLTAVNTAAAVAGSLIAGFVALPWLGIGGSIFAVAVLYAVLAMLAYWQSYGGARRWVGCVTCVAVLAGWYAVGAWEYRPLTLEEGQRLVSYREGRTASVAVVQNRNGHRVLTINNAYILGSSSASVPEVRQGRLPLLLHPRPERVAFIGVATGMTVSAVLDFPVNRVVAIELVPGVAEAIPDFAPWNRSVFRDRRVELVVEDGRNHLLGTREQFDVIVGDLFVPWRAGTGYLYTVEHFASVARRLADGGLFAQWVAGHQLSVEELRTITASFLKVFPAATLWRNDFNDQTPVFVLVGYRGGVAINAEAVRAGCQRLSRSGGPPVSFLSDPVGVEMLYVCGASRLGEWAAGAKMNVDDKPRIEYSAPRSAHVLRMQFAGPMGEFIAGLSPRRWGYAQRLAPDVPIDRVFLGADEMHKAAMAKSRQNFEQEYGHLRKAVDLVGDVTGVANSVIAVAARYRSRNMTARSKALLEALLEHPDPPVLAMISLAELERADGRDDQAIALLERVADRAPNLLPPRRALVKLLQSAKAYERTEPHLRLLLEANPKDRFLRVDLAHVLHRQGKTEDARREIESLRELPDIEDRKSARRYLRSLGLGAYLDDANSAP